jgi:hypothetical protein
LYVPEQLLKVQKLFSNVCKQLLDVPEQLSNVPKQLLDVQKLFLNVCEQLLDVPE